MKKLLFILLGLMLMSINAFANNNTCSYAKDNVCDDGGEGSRYSVCELGTDLKDCGRRGQSQERDNRGGQVCKQELSELRLQYAQDLQDWKRDRVGLQKQISRLKRKLKRRDGDRQNRERLLQCVNTNIHGKWAAGGGCSIHGCYYSGGGCNVHGCWKTGGNCNLHGCIKKASKTKKACID